MTHPRTLRTLAALLCVALSPVLGCGTPLVRHPVPAELYEEARVPSMPDGIRAWGDHFSPSFQRSMENSLRQARSAYGDDPPVDMLALSGGGSNGPFSAGFLTGWSALGTRPTFRLVTGISTGAIAAPFAFLGQRYDEQLKQISTTVTDKDVFRLKGLLAGLGSDSFADTEPLAKLLERNFDHELLRVIAREHAKGRRLFIGTTNLDAQRPVIWDMGAIATVNTSEALKLFRQIVLASASIPAYFPPVYLKVEAKGKLYDEMHVDGATIDQVILYGDAISAQALMREIQPPQQRPPNVYIIRNGKLAPEPTPVKPRLLDIAGRAIATLTKAEAMGDLYRIYAATRRDGLEFNLAYIPDDYVEPPTGAFDVFDPRSMASLFEQGYSLAKGGYSWRKTPPDLNEPAPPTTNR